MFVKGCKLLVINLSDYTPYYVFPSCGFGLVFISGAGYSIVYSRGTICEGTRFHSQCCMHVFV